METAIILIVVALALFFIVRSFVRSAKGKSSGCGGGCTSCGTPPADDECSSNSTDVPEDR